MANEVIELVAEVRAGSGKGAARAARRENKVPGVVYGAGKEPVSINMNYHYLLKRLKQGRFLSTVFTLKVEGGEETKVVCRGVQRDVVKDLPTHIDFLRLADDTRINVFVPVEFINQDAAPGITRGGSLNVVNADVELSVLAGAIPASVPADLTGKNIAEAITVADLVLPAEVKAVSAATLTVATVAAPAGMIG